MRSPKAQRQGRQLRVEADADVGAGEADSRPSVRFVLSVHEPERARSEVSGVLGRRGNAVVGDPVG